MPPLSAAFAFCGFSYPQSTADRKPTSLFLTHGQKVSSRETPCPNASVIRLTSSHHIGVLSSHHKKKGKYPTRYFDQERTCSRNF